MILAYNKKVYFDYQILESFQAGLSLSGKMVKQIRSKRINITGKYIVYQKGKLQIIDFGNDHIRENVSLLLKKREVDKIRTMIAEKGVSCTIINIKTVGRWIKAEIVLVRGKNKTDKRETIKKRDLDREAARNLL